MKKYSNSKLINRYESISLAKGESACYDKKPDSQFCGRVRCKQLYPQYMFFFWMFNSVVECYLHTVEVTGSNPVTSKKRTALNEIACTLHTVEVTGSNPVTSKKRTALNEIACEAERSSALHPSSSCLWVIFCCPEFTPKISKIGRYLPLNRSIFLSNVLTFYLMKNDIVAFVMDVRYRRISQNATVNDLLKESFRKSIHFCASVVPLLAVINYTWTLIALISMVLFYIFCEYKRLSGSTIPVISKITSYASRSRDEGGFVLGPVTMALGILLTLIVFPIGAARIGILALAFGDGIASLAGKIFGTLKIPFTRGKTLAGSSACFTAVFIATLVVTHDPLKALGVAIFTTIIELAPIQDFDNFIIPLLVSGFVWLLP